MQLLKDVGEKLVAYETDLRARGVEHLYIFGSVARGDDQPNDLDLFIDQSPAMGMAFFAVRDILQNLFAFPVDLVTRDALHPLARARIEAEARRVF